MEKIYKGNWETEFYGLEFKDKRLKKRFFQVMNAISTSPDKSIFSATGTRISAKAAYRLFANETITTETLLESISKATVIFRLLAVKDDWFSDRINLQSYKNITVS